MAHTRRRLVSPAVGRNPRLISVISFFGTRESSRRVMGNKHKPTAPTAPRGKRSARDRAESTKRHLGYAESFISTRIVEAFNTIDCDKDGYLSAADLSHTLGAYGIAEEAAKVSEIIYELDDTGDGRLSLAQVLDGMARLQRSKLRAAGTGSCRNPHISDPRCHSSHTSLARQVANSFSGSGAHSASLTPDCSVLYSAADSLLAHRN